MTAKAEKREAGAGGAPDGAQAVRRALALLNCFRDDGPDLSAADLARRARLSPSTAHRLARTLVREGFLEQDEQTARFRLGPVIAELGQLTLRRRGLHLAGPELDALAQRAKVTADLALRSDDHAVILAGGSLRPGSAVGAHAVGLRRPLHSTALGKVLLAWARPGDDDLGAIGPMTAFTERTIVDPAALRAELRRVRAAGYALNEGESAYGVRTVAVPVLDADEHARFALALRATPQIITDDRLDWFVAQARAGARALEVLLIPPDQRRA